MSGEIAVETLPSKIVQVCSSHISAGPNSGDFVELTALCEDGSLWAQYRSNGYANVPTDGRWYQLHPKYETSMKAKGV